MKKEAVQQLATAVKISFEHVKAELQEHVHSINENTEEIQLSTDHLAEMDSRLAKLEEKVDDIHHMFRQILNTTKVSVDLTKDEQKVFLVLFTYDSYASAFSLAEKTGIPEKSVCEIMQSLIDKGIPLQRELVRESQHFRMDSEFREQQAREQIVSIDENIKQQYKNTLLNQFFH